MKTGATPSRTGTSPGFLTPSWSSSAEVPTELVDKERKIAAEKAAESGKPAEIVAKMVDGSVHVGPNAVLALGRESAWDERAIQAGVTPADPQLVAIKAAGERYSLRADVSIGLAVVGLGVTTYFLATEGRGESEGSLRIGVSALPGAAGAVASGRF